MTSEVIAFVQGGEHVERMRFALAVLVFVAFTGWTLSIIVAHGLFGFLSLAGREPWAMQMLLDLLLALFGSMAWVRVDAKQRGLPWIPYVALAPLIGSPAVLAYVVHREFVALKKP